MNEKPLRGWFVMLFSRKRKNQYSTPNI